MGTEKLKKINKETGEFKNAKQLFDAFLRADFNLYLSNRLYGLSHAYHYDIRTQPV
jgi:hypothetical protein